jgi:hypothetical protein
MESLLSKIAEMKRRTIEQMTKRELIRILDREFSLYIRLLYANGQGMCQYVTTGEWFPWNRIDMGHYCSRNHYAVRWDICNVAPQSIGSNRFRGGDQFLMRQWLVKKFGVRAVETVEAKALLPNGETEESLRYQIKTYRAKIKKLKEGKGL